MVLSTALSRIYNTLVTRPNFDPFPEVKTHSEINKAREIWGEPLLSVKDVSLDEAFERGRNFMSKIIALEIEAIKQDIQKGL